MNANIQSMTTDDEVTSADGMRGFLTPREREVLLLREEIFAGEDVGVSKKYYNSTVTKVRDRIERTVWKDLKAMDTHPSVGDEFRQEACSDIPPSPRPPIDIRRLREELPTDGDELDAQVDALLAMYQRFMQGESP